MLNSGGASQYTIAKAKVIAAKAPLLLRHFRFKASTPLRFAVRTSAATQESRAKRSDVRDAACMRGEAAYH